MKFNSIKDIENKVPKKGSFKHMLRRMDEQGRIVKGVNTTVDVDTNEIPKQAKKFGNTVDKDGRPPTLSKKVKGSSTNVLYNLGMVKESVDKTTEDSVYYDYMLEALGEIDKKSEIYVDMDGVLADFFGRWEQITGKHWREIKGDAIEPALQAIRDDEKFWLELPMTANAKNLLGLIKQVKGKYKILSAPLAGDKKAIPHKKEWVAKNLGFFPPEAVIIDADKGKYATQPDGTPNILIDDFGSNINKWEAAGGIGFKHKDHKFERTAKQIKQAMEEPVEEGNHIPNPKNSFAVGADTAYDFIKLGVNMANLKSMPDNSNPGEPDIVVAPYAGEKEMKYLMRQLTRLGYKVDDIEGYQDTHIQDEGIEPPQIKNEGRLGKIKLSKLRPVQKKRKFKKLFNQIFRVAEDDYAPITIDKHGNIVNGHHRYDALRLFDSEYAIVHMLDVSLDEVMSENFADGKRKGKSRPGRVKRAGASCDGSVTSLRKKAKNASGERAKMYHWCANMKAGRKKKS